MKKNILSVFLLLALLLGIAYAIISKDLAKDSKTPKHSKKNNSKPTKSSMIKISYIMRRLPNLSREEFLKYWMEKHPKSVDHSAFSVLGVKRYIQLHNIDDKEALKVAFGPRKVIIEEFDGIAEIWVEKSSFIKNWSTEKSKEYMKAFFNDEKKFVDWSRSTILVSKEMIMMP